MPDSLLTNATRRKENLIEKAKQNLGLNTEKVLSLFEVFKLIATFPIWYPKSLYNKAQEKGPLPKDFDFTYALT
ncbi:unnamed protein product, partial [Mesorhabditis belari]|uniref:Uncharacterized protein n=1 Tax=Mesorhabditis belari TaxID=2138241 RepID=A0AAF3FIH3_9BILA